MARRRRSKRYTIKNYYSVGRGATVSPRNEPTVAGAVMMCIVTMALLIGIVITYGPVIDYFTAYMLTQAGNPYAAPVLEIMPWTYLMVLLGAGVAIILVWRTVIRNIWYEMQGEF